MTKNSREFYGIVLRPSENFILHHEIDVKVFLVTFSKETNYSSLKRVSGMSKRTWKIIFHFVQKLSYEWLHTNEVRSHFMIPKCKNS